MSHGYAVFISYARGESLATATELAKDLAGLAFLDVADIDDGDYFPERLLNAILDARIVVIFATRSYATRRFCRLEMRLALAAGDETANHLVIARGDGWDDVLDSLPPRVSSQNWPAVGDTARLRVPD